MRDKVKKYIKIGSIIIFLLVIFIYTGFKTKDLIYGVSLKIEGVENNQTYFESKINILGRAKNVKNLTINDRKIFLDQDWGFKETIFLLPGYNVITIRAEDRFGKRKEKMYQIISKK